MYCGCCTCPIPQACPISISQATKSECCTSTTLARNKAFGRLHILRAARPRCVLVGHSLSKESIAWTLYASVSRQLGVLSEPSWPAGFRLPTTLLIPSATIKYGACTAAVLELVPSHGEYDKDGSETPEAEHQMLCVWFLIFP